MKVLSLNFLTCAVKACKSSKDSYPLHPRDAELVQDDIELNPDMILNVLPRLDWTALCTTASEVSRREQGDHETRPVLLKQVSDTFMLQLGFPQLPEQPPTAVELRADEKTLKDLHHLLLETQMSEGKLVCGNCGHEYAVKEGIANFLLPSHLV